MAKLFRTHVATLLVATSIGALLQAHAQDVPSSEVAIVSDNAIEYIPPIAEAVMSGDPDRVREALKERADSVNDQVRAKKGRRAGFTPLILAAALSEPTIVGMLIEGGAKISILDDYNRSAFWYAAFREDVGVTEKLLNASSAEDVVNTPDFDFKRTPLHLAVRGNEPKVVALLLKGGASKSETEKDVLDETPIEYCQQRRTTACRDLPSR